MFQKIVNKSKVWASHGRHKGLLGVVQRLRRESSRRPTEPVYGSVRELMDKRGS